MFHDAELLTRVLRVLAGNGEDLRQLPADGPSPQRVFKLSNLFLNAQIKQFLAEFGLALTQF
jgi:hypothetical protein